MVIHLPGIPRDFIWLRLSQQDKPCTWPLAHLYTCVPYTWPEDRWKFGWTFTITQTCVLYELYYTNIQRLHAQLNSKTNRQLSLYLHNPDQLRYIMSAYGKDFSIKQTSEERGVDLKIV